MNNSLRSLSGWFNLRTVIASTLCLGGVSLGLVTFAARPLTHSTATVTPKSETVSAQVAAADARTAALRIELSSGFERSLRAAIEAGQGPAAATPALTPPDAADLAAVANLPTNLQVPIANLRAATRQAIALMGGFIPATAENRAALDEQMQSVTGMMKQNALPTAGSPQLLLPPSPLQAPGNGSLAALVIGAALDQNMEALRAAAAQYTVGAGTSVTGCDVLDETPLLCVGSAANNTYTANEAMLIDLGGDDTYLNSAGGAPVLGPDGLAYITNSTNIDLGGSNTYIAPSYPSIYSATTANTIAQGAAINGGVGILVDYGSNDHFTVAPPGAPFDSEYIVAQGASLGGLGALYHLGGGTAVYSIHTPSVTKSVQIVAQAAAVFAGIHVSPLPPTAVGVGAGPGLLIDSSGDDTYSIITDPIGKGGTVGIFAQAFADPTAAFLNDGGGNDTFLVQVGTTTTPPYVYKDGDPNLPPVSGVYVQASAIGGTAQLLTGSGDTSYSVQVVHTGETIDQIFAQGTGSNDVVLDDLGGNNTYTVSTTLNDTRSDTVTDTCACTSAGANETGLEYNNILAAQGASYGGSEGSITLLHDHGSGDDRYSVVAESDLSVTLSDQLLSPGAAPLLTVMGYPFPNLRGQGAADGNSPGVLQAGNGKNSFELDTISHTTATATSLHSTAAARVVAIAPRSAPLMGQGGGLASTATVPPGASGSLIDPGGPDDLISAKAEQTVSTSPSTNNDYAAGGVWPRVQGYGLSSFLSATGSAPLISSYPAQATCGSPGFRGFGTWTSCAPGQTDPDQQPTDDGYQMGQGIASASSDGSAPNAVGQKPSLAFTADTQTTVPVNNHQPAYGEPRAAVAAILLHPMGQPIAGATIHFDLQGELGGLAPSQVNLWQAEGVTDQNGVARANLPLTAGPYTNFGFTGYRFLATYDGIAGQLYPRHVALEITPCSGATCPPPAPVSTVSRKTHGSAGTFDIALPLTGTPGVECRSGGTSGNHQVVITFPSAVTFTGSSVSSGTGSVASTTGSGTPTITVNLTGVRNAQTIKVTLAGVNDGTSTGDVTVPIGVLLGDTTGDGVVDSADITQVRRQSGQVTTESNKRTDLSVDGVINSADITVVRRQSGTALPQP